MVLMIHGEDISDLVIRGQHALLKKLAKTEEDTKASQVGGRLANAPSTQAKSKR